jgi:hypothetical protein
MKYWNKQHKLRERWYKVELPKTLLINSVFPSIDGWWTWSKFDSLKRELQMIDSPGKFYMSVMHRDVYFERQQDAVYFSLRYL